MPRCLRQSICAHHNVGKEGHASSEQNEPASYFSLFEHGGRIKKIASD
jgi:hypothetical protein